MTGGKGIFVMKFLNDGEYVEQKEPVEHLCDKCREYADNWAPTAEKLWGCSHFTKKGYVNFASEEEKTNL